MGVGVVEADAFADFGADEDGCYAAAVGVAAAAGV